jgi:hypothetical protein
MKYSFPTETYGQNQLVMIVDASLLPMVAGKIRTLADEYIWYDKISWRNAYNAIAEMLMMQNGIVESINQLYRLIDSSLNGAVYTASGTPAVVSPTIPAAPGAVDGITAGLRRQLLDMQGLNPSAWPFGLGSEPTTLSDVAAALKQQSPAEIQKSRDLMAQLAVIGDIEGGISAGTGVISALGTWLGDGENLLTEGLLITSILANIAAQAAMDQSMYVRHQQLLVKIDRLITSLDGGATPAPDTNVISELQTTNTLLG